MSCMPGIWHLKDSFVDRKSLSDNLDRKVSDNELILAVKQKQIFSTKNKTSVLIFPKAFC